MKNDTDIIPLRQPHSLDDPLTEIAREGARRMLAAALWAEADAFVAELAETRLPDGRRGLSPTLSYLRYLLSSSYLSSLLLLR